ncbi:hypothetical protein [Burkholderia cepacia]|uniref:hypothetical protein n=1 Tax=Burkholderia cepacia TaxID=292 RepID=UPI00352988B5
MQAMKATTDLPCPRSHRFRRAADVAAHFPGVLCGAAGGLPAPIAQAITLLQPVAVAA